MGKRKTKGGGGASKKQRGDDDNSEDVGEGRAARIAASVERDLREMDDGEAAQANDDDQEEEEKDPSAVAAAAAEAEDPYLLADAHYIKKDTRWRNKQRTLVFCSRGVTSRFRHLCDDVRKLLPHHKAEPKFEKSGKLQDINEVCELKSCNNVCFFESRRMEDLYLWLGRVPNGPSIKFQVLNIHTTKEIRLAGNCLRGSRPILQFDKSFDQISHLKLIKSMFIQAFGTPRNHPKCKPFHDHVMCFYWMDHKIWFRHYQISPETPLDRDDPERQALTEIGPRFVLDPIRILGGSFSGQTLYANAHYMSPTALRVHAKNLLKNPYKRRLENKADRKKREKEAEPEPDPLNEVFV